MTTNTTNTSTDEDIDPRLAAISEALQNEQGSWVTIENGEVVFDTLVAAAIAAVTMDELTENNVAYCNPQCHAAEVEYFTDFIRAFSEDCPNDDYPCSDKILETLAAPDTSGKQSGDGSTDTEDTR